MIIGGYRRGRKRSMGRCIRTQDSLVRLTFAVAQDGDTALDLVKRMGYKETVRLLENGCMLEHRHRLNVHAR